MNIKKLNNNSFGVNSYLVYDPDTKYTILIDPALNYNFMVDYIDKNQLKLMAIILTHGHIDHIADALPIKEKYNVDIYAHEMEDEILKDAKKSLAENFGYKDLSITADFLVKNNDILEFGPMKFKVLHTPGHTKGGICLIGKDHIFTGDTLFAGSMGRTDLFSGNDSHMRASLHKLSTYDENMSIHPGHGGSSTVGKEKQTNPFMRNI